VYKVATQHRTGSSFKVSYPDFPAFNQIPHHARLVQGIGMQDVLELTYTRFNSFYEKVLKTGTPVLFAWKNDKVSETFFGYVVDVVSELKQSSYNPTVIRCMSASFPMKEGGNKIWTNASATEIVSDIAKKFKLKPVVTPSPVRFSQQSLVGHTYWEKVQELARRIGYAAQAFGTALHFHPLDRMIDLSMTSIPIMSHMDSYTNPWSAVETQTLDSFKPKIGDFFNTDSYNRTEKNVVSIDPHTAKLTESKNKPNLVGKNVRLTTKDPLFTQSLPGVISGSAAMTEAVAKAQAQLSRFSMTAVGSGQGDPRIAPYRTIEINGTGSTTDGFWVVKTATHFLVADGRYHVDFTCMSDGTGGNKGSNTRSTQAGPVGIRNLDAEVASGTLNKPTYTKLSGTTTIVKATESGYKITPRKWEGR
jgi:phage protein D